MSNRHYPSDVAFTDTVKAIQERHGSRELYHRMEESHGWGTEITPQLADFIAEQTSVFLATANAAGQPYIQHRGGPPGFIRPLGSDRLGFADFRGNRQYISQGNLSENPKAQLFLIDYARRRRIKIWGEARMVEDDQALIANLMPADYKAVGERALLFKITAWDTNCPQHIPQKIDAADVAGALAQRDRQIAALEQEVATLKARLATAA